MQYYYSFSSITLLVNDNFGLNFIDIYKIKYQFGFIVLIDFYINLSLDDSASFFISKFMILNKINYLFNIC